MRSPLLVAVLAVSALGCVRRLPVERICQPTGSSAMLCLARVPGAGSFFPYELLLDGKVVEVYNGEFRELELAPGDHVIRISDPAREREDREEFTLREGEARGLEISLTSLFGEAATVGFKWLDAGAARAHIHDLGMTRTPDAAK